MPDVEAVARWIYERDGEAGLIREDWDAENSTYKNQYYAAAEEVLALADERGLTDG